jgi:hypothetical protein
MLSDGSEVTVREGEVEETSCKCCTAPVTVVTGYLDVGDYSAGWYTVGVTHNRPGGPVHLPLIRLYLGDWTDQAGADERWGLRIGISAEGPELLDWSETDRTEAAPVFTPLDRAQVLGTPMEPQLFTLIDRVLRDDSRL